MIARSNESALADNVVLFRGAPKRAPLCAQCRVPMAVVRAEPELNVLGAARAPQNQSATLHSA
jgi:hypothetical protein